MQPSLWKRFRLPAVLVALMCAFHLRDAVKKGESVVPVVFAAVLVVGILAGVIHYLTRPEPGGAAVSPQTMEARRRRMLRLIVPACVLVAVVTVAAGVLLGGR